MKKYLSLLLVLGMFLSLAACGESPNTPEAEVTPEAELTPEAEVTPEPEATEEIEAPPVEMPEATPNPLVQLTYEEGMELLQQGCYSEAYDDLVSAADAGSAAAMEALARGVILDMTLADAAAGDDKLLLELSRRFADAGDPWGRWAAGFFCMNARGTGYRYEEAYRMFELAAESGNDEVRGLSLYEIGYMLANGFYEWDSEKALESYLAAADLGNAYAMGNLGLSWYGGTLTEQNDETAIEWFRKGMEAGNENAKAWILSLVKQIAYDSLFPNDGREADYEKARLYYELAAEQKDMDGFFYLGVIYSQGWGVDRDMDKAVSCFNQAMEQGSDRAAYNLAVLYTYGDADFPQDLDKGLEYFCKTAELGYEGGSDLINDIAVKILNGDGFQKDTDLAITWYEKAAEAGSIYACNNLAYLYTYHRAKGLKQDLGKALSFFAAAASLGDQSAAGNIYGIASDILKGKNGMNKDQKTALLWYEQAADLGYVPAMYMTGLLYSDRQYKKFIDPDFRKAVEWFELAADSGDAASMEKLGDIYSSKDSGYLDYEKALSWYSEATDACDPENTKELQRIAAYINNIGVAVSDEKSEYYNPDLAFRAYSKAVDSGLTVALRNLGKAYGIGFGTEVDMDKTDELLLKGNYLGYKDGFLKSSKWQLAKT
ncbi:MAG: SEL1-like repeat protein [Oscillospiraceae bacterium]|nr:SEL1-like repeat protein [Oscillospiraceae bacterium]